MSLKDLFKKDKKNAKKPLIKKSLDTLSKEGADSSVGIEAYFEDRDRYLPLLDYTTASNFAKYGSAEEYYDVAIKRIYKNYPYDGSLYEKLEWENNSNGLDLHIFNHEYPRTNGHALFSPVGYGSINSLSGSLYASPASKEYIYLKGGPHVDNVWSTSSLQTSNLEINGLKGNTVEFWLKKDAFNASFPREVVLDVWRSGSLQVQEDDYARLTIELDRANAASNKSPLLITYKSGSSGCNQKLLGTSQVALSASDGKWHHYAVSFKSNASENKTSLKLYVDGNINDVRTFNGTVAGMNRDLVACVGSLVAAKSINSNYEDPPATTFRHQGYGKLSASLDDFRYWKTERTSKEIGSNYFTNVHGGSNVPGAESPLGVYYKFNEGKADDVNVDRIVLDYSGRVTNGIWTGYRTESRSIKSAIVQASASVSEFKDPIIYTENAKLSSFIDEKKELGRDHDIHNSTCIYYSFPSWILEEEEFDGDLKNLSQIIGSYFDTLYAQIQDLSKLKHHRHEDFKNKPLPFMKKVLKSFGLEVPELFVNMDILTLINNKDEEINYEQKLHDVKNFIYTNLYNNLVNLYKLKGTEESFRNILRCYGIDEKLININLYTDNVVFEPKEELVSHIEKVRMIDFSREANQGGMIFQQSSSFDQDTAVDFQSLNYVSGTHDTLSDANFNLGTTTQAMVNFPALLPFYSEYRVVRPLSSSLFGALTDSDSTDNINGFKRATKDYGSFGVYAVKRDTSSPDAKLVVKSRSELIPTIETDFIKDLYSDTNWNISVRVVPESLFVSGATSNSYAVKLYAASAIGDTIDKRYEISRPITRANAIKFHKHSKRFYMGAFRQNFTGSVIDKSDIKIGNFRHWLSELDNHTLDSHAKEVKSFGVVNPAGNPKNFIGHADSQISTINSLAVNWEFDSVTGSNGSGHFIVPDISSGSAKYNGVYEKIANYYHPARAIGFKQNSTDVVFNKFVASSRKAHLEENRTSNMVSVHSLHDDLFKKVETPNQSFFSIEKSFYRTISDEMLNLFSSIKDYSTMIGNPVNRYRANYKSLDKLREMFFAKVQNTPSVERYLEFYKWIDSSIDVVLEQFIPATANISPEIRNIIESHVLERNKIKIAFPTLEKKISEPIGVLKGINELRYDWNAGHAPFAISLSRENASATLTIDNTSVAVSNSGRGVFIRDSIGNITAFFRFSDTAIRRLTGDPKYPNVRIISIDTTGITNTYQLAVKMREAINSEISNIRVTAGAPSPGAGNPTNAQTITLTQDFAGEEGNVSNNSPIGVSRIPDGAGNYFSITDFTGGQGYRNPESVGCLWWNDRIERTDSLVSTGDASVDKDRETLRKRINSVISGSDYGVRKLSRPYKFSADFQVPIHAGDNFHLNKKKDFYIGTTRPLSTDFIQVSSSNLNNDEICSQRRASDAGAGIPRTLLYYEGDRKILKFKEKLHFKADVSHTNNDYSANHILPFVFYSSSIDNPTDYKRLIQDRFRTNVDITNLHSDSYGDDREIPLQGPFTQHFIGGHFHRHVPLNRSGSFGISSGNKQKTMGAKSLGRATLTTTGNGNAAHGLTAGQKINIISTDGTSVDYFVSDTNDGGVAHLGAVTNGATLKSGGSITATLTAGATGIAVGFNVAGTTKQNTFLSLLKEAIEHANGHNGKILVSPNPAAAAEPQSRFLTQRDSDAKATATIRVTDGDAAHGLTAGQKITLTSTDGTIVDYFISDINDGGRGNLGAITEGMRLKDTGTINATLTAGATGIAVGYNTSGGNTQQQILQLLKAAIEHASGHNGKIIVSDVPNQANGNQDITLTQRDPGSNGNTTSSENLATISVHSDFSGGTSSGATTITENLATITKTNFLLDREDFHGGLDVEGDRREAFFIRMNDNELLVVNPDAQLSSSAEGSSYRHFVPKLEASANSLNVLREPLAKRPVNIKNIKTTTGSLYKGNYHRDYEIIQGTSMDMSKAFLAQNASKAFRVDEVQDPDAKATATIRVTDGDAAHGLTAGQKITLTSTDGTVVDYFISDTNDGGRGNLGAVTEGMRLKDTGPINASLTPGATGISVGYNTSGGNTQQQILQLLKAAIEHASGHNGKIIVSDVPNQADGNQDITLTQRDPGPNGNTVSSENLATISVHSDFSGGGGLTNITFTLGHEFSSSYFRGRKHSVRPERTTGKKNFIVNRFSAPGGPETAGNAHGGAELDVPTTQYSVYNTMNYRNLASRFNLDALQSESSFKFGTAPIREIREETEFDGLSAQTHVTISNTTVQGETIILEDAGGRTFTLTTSTQWRAPVKDEKLALWNNNNAGARNLLVTTINLLRTEGVLDLHAFRDPDNANKLFVRMGKNTGENGNGKTITGTAVSNGRLSAAAFSGGTNSFQGYLQTRVTASYHNINRNTRYHPSDVSTNIPQEQSDNFFVQRQIPQSDLNYAWINRSTVETTNTYFGYENRRFTYPKSGTDIGFFESPRFVSASEIGFAKPVRYTDHFGVSSDRYFLTEISAALYASFANGHGIKQFIATDYVGLNTVVLDNLDFKNNLLGYKTIDGHRATCTLEVSTIPSDNDEFTLTDYKEATQTFAFDTGETSADGSFFKARGSLTFNYSSAEAPSLDTADFTLVSQQGTSKTYIFDDDNDGATGTLDGSSRVRIQINGLTLTTLADFRSAMTQIKNAIEHSNGHDGEITVTQTDSATQTVLSLRQNVAGADGNRTISLGTDLTNSGYTTTDIKYCVASNFTNGDAVVVGLSGAGNELTVANRIISSVNAAGIQIFVTEQVETVLTLEQNERSNNGLKKIDDIVGTSLIFSEGANIFTGLEDGLNDPFLSGIAHNASSSSPTGSATFNINYLNDDLYVDSGLAFDASQVQGFPLTMYAPPRVLNAILSNRGSKYGWNPWNQLRAGNHKLARKQRRENIYTIPLRSNQQLRDSLNLPGESYSELSPPFLKHIIFSNGDEASDILDEIFTDKVRGTRGYSWPDRAQHFDGSGFLGSKEIGDSNQTIKYLNLRTSKKEDFTYNSYISQSVITSRHKPIIVKSILIDNKK